jgi:hypothetical protein
VESELSGGGKVGGERKGCGGGGGSRRRAVAMVGGSWVYFGFSVLIISWSYVSSSVPCTDLGCGPKMRP